MKTTGFIFIVALLGLFVVGTECLRCYSNYAGNDGDGHNFEGEKEAGECNPGFNYCIKALCDDGQHRYACGKKDTCNSIRCAGSGTTKCSSCNGDLCNGDGGGGSGGAGGGGGSSVWDNGANANGNHLLASLALAAILLMGVPHILE